jgi:pimeloyl-ACP methyl ester carboxylesterase/predicted glycosyltransferase
VNQPPAPAAGDRAREQSRARYPDTEGFVVRDGVKVFYEVYGDGAATVVLMPTWPIAHCRMWKAQIPYLARRHRVITIDPRGNGRSDRPRRPEAYNDDEYVADTLAVLDATATRRAVLVALCSGVRWSIELAAYHPDRVLGIAALAPGFPFLSPPHPERQAAVASFDEIVPESAGWAAWENRHFWQNHYADWARIHSGPHFMVPEPHSTKISEDLEAWALDTDAETLLAVSDAPGGALFPADVAAAEALCRRVQCPMLIIHGSEDRCQPSTRAERLGELTNGRVVILEGAGHAPMARHPVKVNLLLGEFLDELASPAAPAIRRWTPARRRTRRMLYLSSPIGLGHAMRDLAIADELRKEHPDLRIDWLTQHPVTTVLAQRGERIHPAATFLANESNHIESEAADHDLHVFQAIRRMDEILVANFMVFHELLRDDHYDLVVGDESWDVDYFWHENPELKRAPFCWMTDFVGWLPMPDGGDREADLAADYNEEMIEQIARYPRLRDRSIFVGNPDDIVPLPLGPGLPAIRDWTEAHYDFSGYITGFDPRSIDREQLRRQHGLRNDERVCLVTVGGSGVGKHLLRKVIDAFPAARRLLPDLRMIVVTGPRIDPRSLPQHEGLDVVGHVDDLYRLMAACDAGIVQGGLSTTMELTALRIPFLYFPIQHHFEQNFHVRHRLDRYNAGRCMDYPSSDPDSIATALAEELARPVQYRRVETDGARRAAKLIGELL